MKKLQMKKIKKCFGIKKYFFKEKEEECKTCQFKRKCLLKVKRRIEDD